MASERVNITSPVGRIVMGNLYEPNTKDFDGKPLTIKTGQNAGQPRVNYFIGLAIPKGAEPHWAHTPWGGKIWAVGNQAFPQAAQRPDFAWKIEDGDSTIPNKRNRRPCDNEGWARHWILKLSGGYAPKVYRQEGAGYVQVLEPDYVKPGYFVEVAFNVDSNAQQNNPGVYLNHSMVCFRGYGPEIVFGPNVEEAGFGQNPLPAGASLTPVASSIPLPGASPASPGAPPALPAVPVSPQPQFLQMPAPASPQAPAALPGGAYPLPAAAGALPYPGAPMNPAGATTIPLAPVSPSSTPPAPPAAPAFQMTQKANGVSREAFHAAGWSDAQLVQQGYMLP